MTDSQAKALAAFVTAMQEKLDLNSHKTGWDDPRNLVYFAERAYQELDELIHALKMGYHAEVRGEAADVANFMMFIANLFGGEA